MSIRSTISPRRILLGGVYKNSRDGVRVTDGPFTETKEMIAGYVLLSAESLDDASRWAVRYLEAVETDEVDLREVEVPAEGPQGTV